jgi:peptide/nickel transport system substrate-binding protein
MENTGYWDSRRLRSLLDRRLSRRRLIQLGAAGSAGALVIAAGCGGKGGGPGTTPSAYTPVAGTPTPGGKIVIASASALTSMDPAFWSLAGDKIVNYDLYDWPATQGLDNDGNLADLPNLAESFEWVDGTHLIFHWRQGIKFHDGTDFNADAVQAYYQRVLDPATKSPRAAELRTVDHVETIDNYTTRYVLKEQDMVVVELALSFWSSCFPSPTAIEKYGNDFTNHPVGTGPFMFKSQQPGASCDLVRNPNYWRAGEPYLDGYTVRAIPDRAVVAAALKAGEVDMASNLESRDIIGFQKDPNFNVVTAAVGSIRMVFVNSNKGLGTNPHLRKALSLAINRQEFIDRYSGLAFITPGPLLKGGAYANPDEPDPEYDLERAKQELAAAGYPDGLTIQKLYTTTDPGDQADAQILQAQWAKIGVNVSVDYVAVVQAGVQLATGDYEFAFGGWPGEGDDYALRNIYYSKGVFNGGALSDPDIDRLIDQAKVETDPNKRKELYWQVMRIIMDNTYAIYVVGVPDSLVLSKRVQGFTPDLAVKGEPRMQFQWRKLWVTA